MCLHVGHCVYSSKLRDYLLHVRLTAAAGLLEVSGAVFPAAFLLLFLRVSFCLVTGVDSIAGNDFSVVPCAYRSVAEAIVKRTSNLNHKINSCHRSYPTWAPSSSLSEAVSLESAAIAEAGGSDGATGVLTAAKTVFPGGFFTGVPGIMSSSMLSSLELSDDSAWAGGGTAGMEEIALSAGVGFCCCPVPRCDGCSGVELYRNGQVQKAVQKTLYGARSQRKCLKNIRD